MDIFECAVCLQQFDDPRVISCGHTFCKGCLQKLKPNQLLCPLCRRTFESVDSLPSNFVVLKWMDENKNQTIQKKDIKCDNCEDKLAIVWCERCENSYCKDCDATTHNTGKATQSHIRISLKEQSKKPVFTKCKNHMRDNEVYCVDCDSFICSLCVIDDHQQHKAKSIFKFADEIRVELKSCVTPFQNLVPLVKIDQEIRRDKEKAVMELKVVERKAQVLKEQIIQYDLKIQEITNQTEKVKTSEIVFLNSIQEMRIMDLIDKKKVDKMKTNIRDVLKEVYPELEDSKKQPPKAQVSPLLRQVSLVSPVPRAQVSTVQPPRQLSKISPVPRAQVPPRGGQRGGRRGGRQPNPQMYLRPQQQLIDEKSSEDEKESSENEKESSEDEKESSENEKESSENEKESSEEDFL